MNKDIENIKEKSKIDSELAIFWDKMSSYLPKSIERSAFSDEKIFTALKQAYIEFRPLITDEVLKVVVENERQRIGQEMDLIWRDTHHDLNLFEQAICELQEDLLFNSSTLEGERSEHLSPNKENDPK